MAAETPGRPAARHAPPPGVIALLALAVLAPMVGLSVSPWHANGSLWYLGMLPVVIGLFAGARVGFAAALVTPAFVGISLLLQDMPIVGALYMAAIGVATGFAALRGWHLMLSFAGPLAAFALIGDLDVGLPSGTVAAGASLTSGLVTVGFVLLGGLWAATLGQLLVRAFPVQPPATTPQHTAGYFAAALGLLVGVGTYIAMSWLGPDSWWLILTVFVVVQPYYADSAARVAARVAGTLAGALVAVVIVAAFKDLPAVITALALALTIAAAWANMKLPYWAFVTFLTPAVVLQTAGGSDAIIDSIVDRAAYTLVGAAGAAVVLTVGHTLVTRGRSRSHDGSTPA
ncbi:FUSC family protein [Isoptericola croceus]|uniref:FUSC family protein n=1 Tax=Isoptericola croceus TaxID=3031406 RepID=UPI0023F98EBF|nr:FUSC family protein [Isoptericola croceus]